MVTKNPVNLGVGVALIVVGLLLILGRFSLTALLPIAGLVLTIAGVLVLVKVLPGGNLVGAIVLVIGILLLGNFAHLPSAVTRITDPILELVNLAAGVVLLILGIVKLNES